MTEPAQIEQIYQGLFRSAAAQRDLLDAENAVLREAVRRLHQGHEAEIEHGQWIVTDRTRDEWEPTFTAEPMSETERAVLREVLS